jgi:transposase
MKVGKHTYIYEVTGYRDEKGKPRNTKHPVGKVDPETGEPVYKPEYIARMAAAGTPVSIVKTEEKQELFTRKDLQGSSIKEYGAPYFLTSLAESLGMLDILKEAIPHYWSEYLTLAIYLLCTEDPLMYCGSWLEDTETLPVGDLGSQRISELLHAVSDEDRIEFYRGWSQYRSEREYLALDITSISSWSSLIEDVEWGYNRDHENLPQINVCMLMGEHSRLPVFPTVYSGSLKDVSTLKATVEEIAGYLPGKPVLLVMDKGFYSKKNVDLLLKTYPKHRFIMPAAFTARFAKDLITAERDHIDTIANTIVSGKNSVRGVCRKIPWGEGKTLYAHLYFNVLKASNRKEDVYAHVSALVKAARENPANPKLQQEYEKYLIITKAPQSSMPRIKIRYDVIEKELETAGWLILLSSNISDSKKALDIYRAKDVVEKGFYRIKNSIDLGRMRIHSQQSMQNKLFAGFISLILLSHINKVMLEKGLYKHMTLKKLILTLKKLRLQRINGQDILFPVTKDQRSIFEAFHVDIPLLS